MKGKAKQIFCILIVVAIVIVSVPTTHYLLYLNEIFSSIHYIYDESDSIGIKELIQKNDYTTADFWFKNNNYEEAAYELLNESKHEYYEKLSYTEQVFAKEILLEPLYDFKLTDSVLDKLSGNMFCLSKKDALFLLTQDGPEQSLGRICLTLSARPSPYIEDDRLGSIDLLLINDTVYALVTYNTGLRDISLYQTDISVDDLINDTDFTPYFEVIERENFTEFDMYLGEKLPSIAPNNFYGLLIEICGCLFFVALGFLVGRKIKKEK